MEYAHGIFFCLLIKPSPKFNFKHLKILNNIILVNFTLPCQKSLPNLWRILHIGHSEHKLNEPDRMRNGMSQLKVSVKRELNELYMIIIQSNPALRTPAYYRHLKSAHHLLCPWVKKALTFLLNSIKTDTLLIWAPSMSPLSVHITRFDCILIKITFLWKQTTY